MTVVIDGRAVSEASRLTTAARVRRFATATGKQPGLATILVGDDPASEVYVRNKRIAATRAGFVDQHHHLAATVSQEELSLLIGSLASDDEVSGILLQLPLPDGLDRAALLDGIPPAKDVDGLTTLSQGLLARGTPRLVPCTPSGIIELLDSAGIAIQGAEAVVVGRSELVGHPIAELLLRRGATVTIAHSHTRELPLVTSRADILVVAAGIPGLIGLDDVKPGAAVIDVGIHRTDTGLTGDVRFEEVLGVAGWITPVPGGVGPMTIANLLSNTITAAENVAQLRTEDQR